MDALFPALPVARRPRRPRNVQTGIPAGQSLAQPWSLDGALNVVLFAGMGGACQGLEAAGYPVHVAVNHDRIAIAAHKALNPHTKHLQADIYEVCPLEATGGRKVNILWASPDCRDHSVAKGGAPRSPRVRSMPWQVCRWVGTLRRAGLGPSTVMLENVREIRGWGPLVAKRDRATGRVLKIDSTVAAKGERVPREQQQLVRDPRHIGRHWRAWLEHMRRLGVDWQDRDLICADYGVPTSRKRLFGVGQLDGLPIVWPEQTHAQRHTEAAKSGRLLPHASAASIIDWGLELPSIFTRKKPLQPATLKRIAAGMQRFVLKAAEPFLVHTNHRGERPPHGMTPPAPTFTGANRGEMALVAPALVPTTHTTSGDRIHDGLTPCPVLTAGVKGGELAVMAATVIGAGGRAAQTPPIDIGGALNTSTTKEDRCVVAAHLTRYHGERRPGEARGIDPADGLATQTTENRFGIVAAHLTKFNENSVGTHPADPIDTVMAGAPRFGLVGATLAAYRATTSHSTTSGRAPNTHSVETPLETITTSNGEAVVAAYLTEHRGASLAQAMDGAIGAQTAVEHHAVTAAWLVQHNTGVVGHPAEDATSTLTTAGTQQQVAGAFLIHQRGTGIASSPADAARTMATGGGKGGDHIGVGAAYLTEYYGQGGQHQAANVALNTLPTVDRFSVTRADLANPPLTPQQIERARQVADFLRHHGVWTGGDLVTVDIAGTTWIIADIGMRMLKPKEAAAAHELRMPATIFIDGKDRPLTKTQAMKLIGNSVPQRMAKLLASLNGRHPLDLRRPAVAAE